MRAHEDNKLLKNKLAEYHPAKFLTDSEKLSDREYIGKIRGEHISNICRIREIAHYSSEGGTTYSYNKIYDVSISKFTDALRHNGFVRVIDLSKNTSFLCYELVEFLDVIVNNPRLPLECLLLSCDINWDVLDALSGLLLKKPSLEILDLSQCQFTFNIPSDAARSRLNRFGNAVNKSHLRYLSLPCTQREYVSEVSFQFIQNFDAQNTHLLEFYIKDSYLRRDVDKLSRRLMTEKLNLILSRNRTINHISNTITELKNVKVIKGNKLNLSGKVIKASDFSDLVNAIIENKNLSIEVLNLNGSLKDFSLDAEIVYLEGLIKLLTRKTSLRSLDISDSLFANSHAILTLAHAVAQNYRLSKLVLEKSAFSTSNLEQFVNIICDNKSLTDISFSVRDKKQKVDKTIYKTLKAMAARNRSNLSKLQKAIKGNSADQVQLVLKSGANPFACGECRRNRLSFSRRRQSQIIELETSSTANTKIVKGKEKVFNDESINTMLSRAQRQLQCSVKSSDELIISCFKLQQKSADPEASYQLALRYLIGHGVKQSNKKAFNYFKISAKLNHAESQYRLGLMYYQGIGCKSNISSAIEFLNKSREQNYALAHYHLGLIYSSKSKIELASECFDNAASLALLLSNHTKKLLLDKSNVLEDENFLITWTEDQKHHYSLINSKDELFKAIKQEAQNGNASEQYNLSIMFMHGIYTEKDMIKSFEWCKKSAKQEYPNAQFKLYWHYFHGEGVGQDENQALEWLEKAAKQDYRLAQTKLCKFQFQLELEEKRSFRSRFDIKHYEFDTSTLDFISPNKTRKRAKLGSRKEQYRLSVLFMNGELGIIDMVKSFYWCKRSAKQGYPLAKYKLFWHYYYAQGVNYDGNKALDWLKRAARQGHQEAQYKLGMLYYCGDTTSVDYKQAYDWCVKAAKTGHKQARYQSNNILIKNYYKLAMDYFEDVENQGNPRLAADYLVKAASFGYARAYYDLGMLYYPKSEIYDEKNLTFAINYLTLACEGGYAKAFHQLGILHADKDLMLFYDINTAIKYFEKARQLGYKRAKSQLKHLKAKHASITSSDEDSSCESSSLVMQRSNKC